MKKIFIIMLCTMFFAVNISAQESFFDRVADMPGVTSVSISPKMFQMMKGSGGMEKGKVNIDNISEKLTKLQILSSEEEKASEILRKETSFINKKNGYEELLRVKDGEEKVFIYCRNIKDDNNEYVLLVDEGKEFTFIVLEGKLTMEEIQGMVDK